MKTLQPLKSLGILIVSLLVGTQCACADATVTTTGSATVIDGDTIKVNGIVHRLQYIDAPEFKQTCTRDGVTWLCGAESAKALRNIIRSREVLCESSGEDIYGRRLSVCSVHGRELNAEMVANGHALAFRRYGDQYVKFETSAKEKKLGLWAGDFVNPWDYRDRGAGQAPPEKGCAIKGNINAKGEKLYHLPSDPSYSATVVNGKKGERWFCTEASARQAGWVPAWGRMKVEMVVE